MASNQSFKKQLLGNVAGRLLIEALQKVMLIDLQRQNACSDDIIVNV